MSAERDALAPCPFCGSDNIRRADERPGMSWYWIKCDGCGAGFDEVYPDQAAADALWNRRALEVSAKGAQARPEPSAFVVVTGGRATLLWNNLHAQVWPHGRHPLYRGNSGD